MAAVVLPAAVPLCQAEAEDDDFFAEFNLDGDDLMEDVPAAPKEKPTKAASKTGQAGSTICSLHTHPFCNGG